MKIRRFIKSFKDAGRGIKYVFTHEQNFRIQLLVATVVIILMFILGLRSSEVVVILFLILAVLILELLNSALEKFVDLLKPRLHYQVEVIKDIMAAMVLVVSLGALLIGAIIFLPYISQLFII